MKKIFFVLVLLLFAGSAQALVIYGPEEIPENVNWVIGVHFDSTDSFDTAEVYLDYVLGVSAYTLPNGSGVVDETQGEYVLKAFFVDEDEGSKEGLVLNVSFFGVMDGAHTVTVKTFKEGGLIAEAETEIYVFKALSQQYKYQLESELARIKQLGAELEEKIGEIEANVEKLNSAWGSKESTVEEINSIVEELKVSVSELGMTVTQQENIDEEIYEKISTLNEILNGISGSVSGSVFGYPAATLGGIGDTISAKDALDTGSVALGRTNPMFVFLGLLIIVVFVVIGVYFKRKEGSIYGSEGGIGSSFDKGKKTDISGKELEEEFEGEKKAKWAIEPREKETKEKKFKIGDLIKKKK